MFVNKNNFGFFLLCLIILFLPLHYFICEIILSRFMIDNIFRDFVIMCLFVLITRFKIKKKDMLILICCMILVLFALFSFFINNYAGTFNVLRTYIVPMLFYFVCSNFNFTKEKFNFIQKIMVIELALIGIIGLIQAFFLGDDFLVSLGYPSVDGFLDSSSYYIGGFFGYQRNIGTFVSPNVCGVALALAVLVHLLEGTNYIKENRTFILLILIISLIGTFSRSAIVGALLAVMFISFVKENSIFKIKISKKILWLIPAIILVIIFVYLVDLKFLNGIFFKMLASSFLGTIAGTDVSMQGHIRDLFEPLLTIINNPFGLGFGSNGPMAIGVSATYNVVESSIYLMMFEVGILPAIIIFVPYFKLIFDTLKNRIYKYYVPFAVETMILTTYFLLPNIQAYEVSFYSMMFLGFYYNKSVKEIYTKKLMEE